MGMRLTYFGKVFGPEDFLSAFSDEVGKKPFLADLSALVTPSDDSVNVEIVSVKRDPDGKELASYLKRDKERELEVLMRTFYFAEARRGLEGEGPAEDLEIA